MPARRPPEQGDQRRLGERRDLTDRRDPAGVELAGRHPPDAPEPFDRKRVEKGQLTIRRHHQQTVRLGHAARDLGEELRSGHADRERQTDPLEDLAPQPCGDLGGPARDPLHPVDVEEGLVDRQPFDQRRRVLEHAEQRLARLGVGRHPGLDHDRVRAQPTGLGTAHRGADAVGLGLVAGGQHDAAADDHRPPAQPPIVSLLDRREERVDVRVEDRSFVPHEHMFASP